MLVINHVSWHVVGRVICSPGPGRARVQGVGAHVIPCRVHVHVCVCVRMCVYYVSEHVEMMGLCRGRF